MPRARSLALLAALLMPLGAPLVAGLTGASAEAAWWERTRLDADGDRIDDALDAVPEAQRGAPRTLLLAYASMPGAAERDAVERAGATLAFAPAHFPLLVVRAPLARAPALAALEGVVLVEADDEVRPLLDESVPLIGAPLAWSKYGVRGAGVTIAVLDDGAYEQHPDLREKLAASHNAAASSSVSGFQQANQAVVPAGENGHATHVAGTLVGTGSESSGRFRGVAPGAAFVNVQVFTAPNRTSTETVLRGLDWVLANREQLGIRVAVLSLGGRMSDGTDALSRAVDVAVDKGLVVVAASGNAGPREGTITSPGAAEKAITVGAVDKRKRLADFSSRGPTPDGRVKPDLVAPGHSITSTVPPASTTTVSHGLSDSIGDRVYYGPLSGTSMAAPHVAGVAALMLEANPALTPREVKRILLATAQDVAAEGVDNATGFGFVNGIAAVQVAENPALLQSSRFSEVLARIPDPPPESFVERLSYQMGRLSREGTLGLVGLLALVAAAALVGGGLALRARKRDSPEAPAPDEQR